MTHLLRQYEELAKQPLSAAKSLPFGVYRDEQVARIEARKIFHEQWVFVCAAGQLSKTGDYFAFYLAGEAVALIHGKDGKIRAMSNNCSHRGTPLLKEGFGKLEKNIICPYHAWVYADNGELRGVPFDTSKCVDKKSHELPKYRLEEWQGLLFINLSENPTDLRSQLEKIEPYLQHFETPRFTKTYYFGEEKWNTNWKLAIENGIESYHLFQVHQKTLEQITPTKKAFYVAGDANWTITAGENIEQRSKISEWLLGKTPEPLKHYLLIFLPPNFIGVLTYISFDWLAVFPDGAEHCKIMSGGMSNYTPSSRDQKEMSFASAFLQEDKDICELVQRGMSSSYHRGGQLVDMERIVVDFHQHLGRALFQSPVSAFFETEKAKLFK